MVIPALVPPLRGLSVIVTRPAQQAESLCASIEQAGGEVVRWPTIDIAPREVAADIAQQAADWIFFLSANAVQHGAQHIVRGTAKIAAIGKTTAAALAAVDIEVDLIPEEGSSSEALLAHPDLTVSTHARVLIVRGRGGREILRQTLQERGATVEVLEVYERLLPAIDDARREALETAWQEGGTWVATATSVEALENLTRSLSPRGLELLQRTPLVVASQRIETAAHRLGLQGDILLAPGADDLATLGTLERWQTRARVAGPPAQWK
jgi:uroporphyrinogen-III synthase